MIMSRGARPSSAQQTARVRKGKIRFSHTFAKGFFAVLQEQVMLTSSKKTRKVIQRAAPP